MYLKSFIQTQAPTVIVSFLFFVLSSWWVISFFALNNHNNLAWAATYQLIALCGGFAGFLVASLWGGQKSVLGKAILFFALGLFFQVFGQSVFSYYNLVIKVPIPYPSLADVGYFGSIPLYIYATWLLARASGGLISLRSHLNKFFALILPLGMLLFAYFFFLRGYEFVWDSPLKTFLDFGYPFGQAIYVSIALLTYILSKKYLGGVMKNGILLILFALAVQFVADYNFLYQVLHETWFNGGYGDFLYLLSYFLIALGIIRLGQVFKKIRET